MRFIDYKNEEVVIGSRVAYTHADKGSVHVGYVKDIKRGKQRTTIYIEDFSNNSFVYSTHLYEIVVDRLCAQMSNGDIRLFRVVKI